MKGLLHSVREKLGAPPRVLDERMVQRVVARERYLGTANARRLLRDGTLVFGLIAVPFETRFIIVYSPDPDFDPLLTRLGEVAERVREADRIAAQSELKTWLDTARIYRRTEVPKTISRAQPIVCAMVEVPAHLCPRPFGILPVLVHDDVAGAMVLPSPLFTDELRRAKIELCAI